MTDVDIVAEVERRLWPLDERAKEAVKVAVELARQTDRPAEPKWQGENPTVEEALKLDEVERILLMDKLSDRNADWLERKRLELGARWMLVVDGEILVHGETWDNYPSDEEIEQLCYRSGRMLLLHTAPLLIEERSHWHTTIYRSDPYPTLPVTFSGRRRQANIVADFDTGSPDVCVDADLLANRGVIRILPFTPWRRANHLGEAFWFTAKDVEVGLAAESGGQRTAVHRVMCIRDWAQSPFVSVNPSRSALVGRDLCHKLQPTVALNFARHETIVEW